MALLDSPFEMTYGPCQDQSSSLPALGRLALCIIRDPLGAFQVGERTPTRATQTETSPPLHSASPSSTLHHTFTTDLTLVSCGCSKCSIYRSEAGCLEGYCCLARHGSGQPWGREQGPGEAPVARTLSLMVHPQHAPQPARRQPKYLGRNCGKHEEYLQLKEFPMQKTW